MKSSLNSASPVIWTSGRISTPVLLHVHQEVGEPAVLGRVRVGAREQHAPLGVVRERRPHLLAGDDVLVALRGPRASSSEARSEPDSGSEKPWHHISSARQDRREEALLLLVGAVGDHGRPAHRQPEHVGHLRRARARANSSNRIACSICVAPAPPYSVGQVRPAQPRSLSLRCQSRRNSKEASSPSGSLPGWFSSIHDAQRVAELLLRRRKRQVHGAETNTPSAATASDARGGGRGATGARHPLRPRGDRHAAEDQHQARRSRRR